ncbi:ras GTPase-activating protein-binding protein 2-like [Heracleum sosnowskyi]|uniref:Ras GTPase-activating protein-binding protein 2-like n=1 Tax=Heracleum sosnowskyi TaxID=360622 RepID=A0AAD8M1E1_9APIA|nr:ras GTPase-activating protein-binding protein 2-like [Heracleum sosnowskyi]
MASGYPGAAQVGSYFVTQYYQVLQQKPDCVHQFYNGSSTVIRVDGELTDTASDIVQIHRLVMSTNFTGIEVKTINSLDSWNGGVLVVVSGSVKSKEFIGRKKFVQTFILAPQEKGFFVLNDIFHLDEEVIHQQSAPTLQENRVDYQQPTPGYLDNSVDYQHSAPLYSDNNVDYQHSAPYAENIVDYQNHSGQTLHDDIDYQHQAPIYYDNGVESQHSNHIPLSETTAVPNYEAEVSEHLNSVHFEDGPVNEYSFHDQQHQEQVVDYVQEAPVEESPASLNVVNYQQETLPAADEPIAEPQKFSYASILRATTGKPAPLVVVNTYPKSTPAPVSEWDSPPQSNSQQSNSVSSFLPDSNAEVVEEAFSQGESKSVYVKNLPPTVSTSDIQQEFENFGRIKPDGVFIKNRKELGVCFAFVEFEDVESVQNAIKASPIHLVGRQVYIEERRPSSMMSMSRGGGRRGRGRGSYQNDVQGRFGGRSFGRGNSGRGSY